MDISQLTPGPRDHTIVISRVADNQWHALEDEQTVGRGNATRRPDGRCFVSVDAWHGATFERLAEAMLADLTSPLYTLVDEADADSRSSWQRHGFAIGRREGEYVVPTDPRRTGLDAVRPPSGTAIVPFGAADAGLLRAVDRVIRDEVEATVGWHVMPAEVVPLPAGITVADPAKYVVAAEAERYVGLLRLGPVTRRPRIGLVAVRADRQRRGVARALLAHTLDALHRSGIAEVSVDIDESNEPAIALFEGVGARRVGGNLELVSR